MQQSTPALDFALRTITHDQLQELIMLCLVEQRRRTQLMIAPRSGKVHMNLASVVMAAGELRK
jgi:hypothetical protein